MDDSKPLIKQERRPWMSCYFLSGRHQRLYILMAVMLGIAFVVIVSTFYGSVSFGMMNHLGALSAIHHHYGLTTLMPPNEIYLDYVSNGTVSGIMFDAGSTGTRIHIFKFASSTFGNPPRLLDEVFYEIKPGLSSYTAKPTKGAESLIPLLEKAKEVVPSLQRKATPISLKATAGLRLLPDHAADQLLTEVEKVFKTSGFLVVPHSISIMDGIDEGLLAWVTVNYLTDNLDESEETFGTLDLGGGSTQITFKLDSTQDIPPSFLHHLKLFHKDYQMYTHSYLGLGLMSARYQLFGQNETSIGSSNTSVLSSVCIHPKHSASWVHAGKNFTVKGFPNKYDRFKLCYISAKKLVKKTIHKPVQLELTKFYIFSYYFDRAVDAKLVGPNGGKIKIQDFLQAANKVCSNPRRDKIFLCMDLTYITALLLDGYGFKKQAEVLLSKKINGAEVSWALGAALTLTEKVDHLQ